MPDSTDKPTGFNHQMVETEHPIFSLEDRHVGDDLMQTVSARELHAFLENGDKFAGWIGDRIRQYGFIENADFVTFSVNSEKGRPAKNYALSLDMAKELAMVERNEKGKEARRYFIECERRAKAVASAPMIPQTLPDALRLAADLADELHVVREQKALMAPKVEAFDRIADTDGSLCITDAAKTLQVQPKALFAFLHSHHWIYTRQGDNTKIAYQEKLAQGLLEHKTTTVTRSDGSEKTATQVRVTPKGLTRLAREFEPVARAA